MNDRIKCPKCGQEEPAFDYAHVCGPVEVKKSFNKLLRQFEKESKLEIFGLGARRIPWEAALEKYAELIVKECAQELSRVPGGYDSSVFYKNSKILKEHFGVEE